MKPMTEQERQKLAAELRDFLNKNTFLRNTLQKQAYEIALASLTAKEAAIVSPEALRRHRHGLPAMLSEISGASDNDVRLYDAPPVPMIKVPDEFDDYGPKFDEFRRGYNECIAEIKRLNGLGE